MGQVRKREPESKVGVGRNEQPDCDQPASARGNPRGAAVSTNQTHQCARLSHKDRARCWKLGFGIPSPRSFLDGLSMGPLKLPYVGDASSLLTGVSGIR